MVTATMLLLLALAQLGMLLVSAQLVTPGMLLASASPPIGDCTWHLIAQKPTIGQYCSDFDVGHEYEPSAQDGIAFGKDVCTAAPSSNTFDSQLPDRAFFLGTYGGKHYVWCSNSCSSGCCSGNYTAGYRRVCVGPSPAPPPPPAGTIGGLTLVNGSARGAACLDGSAPGYWIRKSSSPNEGRWVIHAEGGGWCYNEKDCAARARMSLGSSRGWKSTTSCYGQCDGILSADETLNPDFHAWNAVWIGYCDGTSMTGARDGTHEGLHYRGRDNLDAVLDSLFDRGMANATDVVFTGGSAGGLAVYLNLDHVAERVVAKAPHAKIVGLADAGFFLDHASYGVQEHVYTDSMKYLFSMSSAQTDADCMNTHSQTDAWQCMMAQYSVPHVSTKLFMAEGMYDSWQLGNVLRLGCGSPTPQKSCDVDHLQAFFEYGRSMNGTLLPLVHGPDRGCFVSACIVHCQSVFNEGEDRWNAWKIRGATLRETFGSFYFGRAGPTVLVDAQPYPNNPSCPVWTVKTEIII